MSAEEVTEAHKGVGCRDLFVAATNEIEGWDVLTDTLRPNAFHNIKTAVEELRDALFAINPSVADYCKHWEVRAERAEAELASERGRLDYIRAELALLREWQREVIQNANAHHAERKDAIARAESAEVELANIRALADRRNERDHSQDTTHQLVAALDQALDIAQAELAAEREKVRTLREALGRIEDAADKHSFGGDMLAWAGDVATAALAIAATKEGAK
jgi:chromosome segregation ATPase